MDINNAASQQETKEEKLIKVECPSCPKPLWFRKSDRIVECECCNNVYTPDELLNRASRAVKASNAQASVSSPDLFQLIDDPDSGIIYLDSRFQTYNWKSYCENPEIIIPEIEAMVEKNKIKHAASPSAWNLDFISVATPLTKKIEGVGEIASDMAKRYSAEDNAEIFSSFDKYRMLVSGIIDAKEELLHRLASDVAFAEKLGMDAAKLDGMKAELDKIEKLTASLKLPAELYDVPEIAEAQTKLDKAKIAEFSAKGINAESNYSKALAMFEAGNSDRGRTVELFESVRGYKKSVGYIDKLNKYFDFHGQFYAFMGKYYTYKAVQKTATVFDPKAKGENNNAENTQEEYVGTAYSFFEVIDGKPSEKPVINDITKIIAVYGNNLYYVKLNKSICAYNFFTENEIELDKGDSLGDHIITDIKFNSGLTSFFLKKKLHAKKIDAKGCFAKLFKKAPQTIERKNNYSIIEVNMCKCEVSTLVEELVDVTEYYKDNLFYTAAHENSEDDRLYFNVVNVNTKENKQILDMNCEIHNVVENHVIYSLYTPNDYNRDLHSYNIETGEDVLIEANIYDYFSAIKGRVFYTVGNDAYCPLFSNSVKGDDRLEIMTKVQNVAAVRADWMYIIKGYGINAALIKISSDGKLRFVVCTQFKKSVLINDNYVYYIDTANSLRVVRSDGMNDTLIADNINGDNVIIDKNCIYYTRYEAVSNTQRNSSLYRMDIDGHNIRKLVFNVSKIKSYDEDTIFVSRNEKAVFEFTIPAAKASEEPTIETKTYNLTRYYTYDKKSEKLDTILTIGLPHSNKYDVKVGCFGKREERESTFREITPKPEFRRKNIMAAGTISGQDVANMSDNNSGGILGMAKKIGGDLIKK
ncbi:MAG: DUF5050 domain-containing protein [Ruminococcaceae bacterium]|nr:DUF5050 domain-containing protein [Oscillospiraceae bacterium]